MNLTSQNKTRVKDFCQRQAHHTASDANSESLNSIRPNVPLKITTGPVFTNHFKEHFFAEIL